MPRPNDAVVWRGSVVAKIGNGVSNVADDGIQDAVDTADSIMDTASGSVLNFVKAVGGDTSSN